MGWNPANWAIVDRLQGQNNQYQGPTGQGPSMYPNAGAPITLDMLSGGGNTLGASTTRPSTIPHIDNSANEASIAASRAAAEDATINNGLIGQLQGQINQLDPTQAKGFENIASSYNLQGNRLRDQNAVAKRNYEQGVQQNTQSYLGNRNGILTNTRATTNSLQRLLGINGAGNSSAAYEQAPYAAGLQGSQQLNEAQQVYGQNAGKLDTSWQDTQQSYSDSLKDLDRQKYQQENSLRSSIANTRAGLLGRMGEIQKAPSRYTGQINDLLAQITQLGQQYEQPIKAAPGVAFQTPDQASYLLNQNRGPAPQAQAGGAASDLNPTFLGLLADKERDPYGRVIG